MSEESVEIVRQMYADPRGLVAAARDRAAQNVVIDFSALYPDRPLITGIDAAQEFQESGPWSKVTFEPQRYLAHGDRVLVLVDATGTGSQSGAQVQAAVAHEFVFKDGLIIRFKVWADRSEALRDAGLSE